ncbi:MAG: hypothetical protein AAGA18_04735 [Verrucomicrobiota bacterium]
MKRLEVSMERSIKNLQLIDRPDGGKRLSLNGAFQFVSAARRMPDGSIKVGCFEHYDKLERFLLDDPAVSQKNKQQNQPEYEK